MAQPYSSYTSQIFLGKIPPSPSPSLYLQFHMPTQYWRNLSVQGAVPGGISPCSYAETGTTAPLLLCWKGVSVSEKPPSLPMRETIFFCFVFCFDFFLFLLFFLQFFFTHFRVCHEYSKRDF